MILAVALAEAAAPPPIAGGSETTGWDEVVLIVLVDDDDYMLGTCTGTLVDPGWVLTAAHCVYPSTGFAPSSAFVAFVDDWEDSNSRNTDEALSLVYHPDYDPNTSANDVALLELPSARTEPTAAIYTGASSQAEDYGRAYTIVGFGASGWSDSTGELIKRTVDVELSKVDDTFIYTEDAQGSANGCFGDSGGPLFRVHSVTGDYAVAGVMSWVSGCEGGTMGSVRTSTVIGWIQSYAPEVELVTEMDDGPVDNPDDEAPGLVADGQPVAPNGVGCAASLGLGWLLLGMARWPGRRLQRGVSSRWGSISGSGGRSSKPA